MIEKSGGRLMTGRALLLGSATGSLTGVANDVQAMAGWLDEMGLALDVREGPQATREGMLDGLDRLARDTPRGAAAVVYYSGHGGHVSMPSEARFAGGFVGGRVAARAFQYLVPTDHQKGVAFRGIFRAELSSKMWALAERTTNITVILDCCHATDMVRSNSKSVVEPWSAGVEAHVAWLVEQGYELEWLPELRNPWMVLLSACAATRRAYEYARPSDGVRCSVFTDCLLDVVSRIREPDRVSWDGLVRRVTEAIGRTQVQQRPQVSGPWSRCLFSERRRPSRGVLTLRHEGERWCLHGGEAVGVVRGDRYCVVDPLTDATQPLCEVVVAEVEGHESVVSVDAGMAERLEAGLVALPLPGGPTHQRCRIDGDGALASELRRRILEVEGLAVVEAAEGAGLAFALDVKGSAVDVLDADGRRLRWPWTEVPELEPSMRRERIDGLLDDLRALVKGADLLSLARRERPAEPPRSLAHGLEWGLVENGAPRPLPLHGAELTAGQRIYVRVENRSFRPIHVSVLDVGVARMGDLLNRNEPEGIDLGVGQTEIFGAPELDTLRGIELQWPEMVPPDGPREESLVVFIASAPLPVNAWDTASWSDPDPARRTQPRPRRSHGGPEWLVRHVSFWLCPRR